MNRDLKHTCEVCNLPYNIKSHSFRVNVISNLLKITTVQNTADIVGHEDIRSTMAYRRYALSKEEIKSNLDLILVREVKVWDSKEWKWVEIEDFSSFRST